MSDKQIIVTYPKSQSKITMKVDGLFAYPEQWKTTDEGNPGMFTYSIKMGNLNITGGKINPRELTPKQLREQEQSKKKGGKKQSKKQENPAEAEKLKQEMERQEQQERRREQEFNKLSDEQKFYSENEDPLKSALLKFEDCSTEATLQGKTLVIFEERVLKDKGQWIYLYKYPSVNEQELAKLKKSKPKNLNANDLNPVIMRTWINLSAFESDEICEVEQRCQVSQVDQTEESPTPNLQKTYVKVKISLQSPLFPKKDKQSTNSVIRDPSPPPQQPAEVKCVNQLKNQLRLGIQSLAMEYAVMFSKELNLFEQQKTNNVFPNSKKNEHTKRKQQFLYDFNVSGKYKILKERLKKQIVFLCENKYADQMKGAKSFTGITCSVRDQFYSQIYNFLVDSFSETMGSLVEENKQKWQQVQVPNPITQKRLTADHLNQFKDQTKSERIVRNLAEYKLIGNLSYGSSMFMKQLKENPKNVSLKYQYSLYCLRNGLKKANDEAITSSIKQYLSYHKDQQSIILFYVLVLIESSSQDLLHKAWIILRDQMNMYSIKLAANKDDKKPLDEILPYVYAMMLFDNAQNKELSDKYKQILLRKYLRGKGAIKQQGSHQQNPSNTQIPSLENPPSYQQGLTNEEMDEIWLQLAEKLLSFGLVNSVNKAMDKIENKQSSKFKKLQIGIQMLNKNYDQVIQKANELYGQTKEINLLQYIIQCCFLNNRYDEAEKYLKILLKAADGSTRINTLFLLGKLYLDMKKYGNAKACLLKYIQLAKQCCGGLSWKLLGIAELRIGNLQQARQCLRYANLNDPSDPEMWIIMAEVYAGLSNFTMVNQCLNSYLYCKDKQQISEQELCSIKLIKQRLSSKKGQNYYEQRIREKMCNRVDMIMTN